jgi:hypothetical protein
MNVLNILDIDKKIKEYYLSKKQEIPSLKERIISIKNSLKEISKNDPVYIKLSLEKDKIFESIKNMQNDYDINMYIIDTEKILEEYVNVLKIPQKVSFLGKKNVNTILQTEIIEKYICKAKKYIFFDLGIDNTEEKVKNNASDICKNCQGKKFDILESDMACINCGHIQEITWLGDCHSEVDRVSISCNYLYDRKNGFRDIMYRYQGKQNCILPDGLLKYIENECMKSELIDPTMERKEMFKNITRYNIIVFLKDSEYSSFAKHVFYIHWKLTGQPRNDISHLEEKILQDFVIFVNAFFKNKMPGEKKSLVKKQFLFYQLLIKYNHQCSIEDFFIIRSIDRIIEQENICQEIFQKLDWNYTSIY